MEQNPFEAEPPAEEPKEIGVHAEKKEEVAQKEVVQELRERSGEIENRLKENPAFEAKGKTFGIFDWADFERARSQVRETLIEEMLMEAREKNDYHREKSIAKLLAFEKQAEDLFGFYAELKLYYPDLAEEMEHHHPYLAVMHEEALESWEKRNKAA